MRKKEKLIREAFEVYQSEKSNAVDEMDDFYSEGFEDKIFYRIQKMHIRNPRAKARIIYVTAMAACVCCLFIGFFAYYQSRAEVRTTQRLNRLWEEAQNYGNVQTRFVYEGNSSGEDSEGFVCQYQTINLTKELTEELENYDIACKETDKILFDSVSLGAATCGTGLKYDYRKVYELSDRSGKKYLILRDEGARRLGLAKYIGVARAYSGENMASSKEVFEKIYGMKSAADIRSITLERYQARSRENPEKLLAVYTDHEDQKEFLSYLQNENKVMVLVPEDVLEEAKENISNLIREGKMAEPLWSIAANEEQEGTVQETGDRALKTWKELTEEYPEKCYLLAFENEFQESFQMGVLLEENSIQVFMDTDPENEIHYLDLDISAQKWLYDLIKEADKVY